ncbi:hypothetical protein BOTCAL_0558g00070 [Botryotinia calthae]|uniref:SRR1-like domain-containing protein n=1 Tax=Botryotinia calthae TaxID=38488 RepID=A0A4Y8CM38_9HELO|nr:hypothetical protein BOTCAL_0558g00070 [Botryotinia calthae]
MTSLNVTESNSMEIKPVSPTPITTSTENSRKSDDSNTDTNEVASTPSDTITSPKDNSKATNMEIRKITTSLTPPIDPPFTPPTVPCDVGDIIPYNKKWMTLKNDGQWHETKGPGKFEMKFCGYEDADFIRCNEHWYGYRKQLKISECYSGYQRQEEKLDVEFEKYKIQHENEKILERLSETMKEGKVIQLEDEVKLKKIFDEYSAMTKTGTSIQHEDVRILKGLLEKAKKSKAKPKNVVCFALGSFERCGDNTASFEQLAVLMKFMELLEIPSTARKVIQDPNFSPGDKRFLARLGFEAVNDPEGFEAINEESFVFQVGGYNFINQRMMDGPWPTVLIGGNHSMILENRSKIIQGIRNWRRGEGRPPMDDWWDGKKKFVAIRKTYDYEDIPTINSIGTGMVDTRFFWRKEVVGGMFQWLIDFWRLVRSLFSERDFDRYHTASDME